MYEKDAIVCIGFRDFVAHFPGVVVLHYPIAGFMSSRGTCKHVYALSLEHTPSLRTNLSPAPLMAERVKVSFMNSRSLSPQFTHAAAVSLVWSRVSFDCPWSAVTVDLT